MISKLLNKVFLIYLKERNDLSGISLSRVTNLTRYILVR